MNKKKGWNRYHSTDERDEDWEEIKDYIKEKKVRMGNGDRKSLNEVFLNKRQTISLKTTTETPVDLIVELDSRFNTNNLFIM